LLKLTQNSLKKLFLRWYK